MSHLINEQEIRSTWAPIIEEATGIQESEKLNWMSQLCHNHKLYEDSGGANIMSLSNNPGPMNLTGMGSASFPSPGSANAGGDSSGVGSGDKAPTLLPLSMQVAGQTVGLDLLPVIPMPGPQGMISYLDFPYEGGRTDNAQAPYYVKVDLNEVDNLSGDINGGPNSGGAEILSTSVDQTNYNEGAIQVSYDTNNDANTTEFTSEDTKVGNSRIDGKAIVRIDTPIQDFEGNLQNRYGSTVELVNALEDHIPGFTGNQSPRSNAASVTPDTYKGANPYDRQTGEETADRTMGLKLFSRQVRADSVQAAAGVTREEIQDLKQYGVDAVAQVESVLTNELTQTINKHILGSMWDLADQNQGFLNGTVIDLAAGSSDYGGDTRGDVHRRILTNILAASNYISTKGRRGAGNFAIVDGKVASALQSVSGFVPNPMANTMSQNAGAIYPLGSIAGINVYTDPLLDFEGDGSGEHPILVGRKGDGNGPGLVFMPYLMAESVETIAEGTMAPKVAVKSRYALVEAGHHPQTQYVGFKVKNLDL